MTFVDTHCHLYDEAFDTDRELAVQRAIDAGVEIMLLPDIDSSSTDRLDALYHSVPSCFRRMAGLHPTSVKEDFEAELAHVRRRLEKGAFVAVGEIGMDLYWDRTYEEQQREVLRCQMLWAEEFGLPVALHIRKAHNEVFALLRDLNRATYRGVMHCFGGSLQEAQRAVEMGFMLGIGGVVTFKNATMAEVARVMPLDRLLLDRCPLFESCAASWSTQRKLVYPLDCAENSRLARYHHRGSRRANHCQRPYPFRDKVVAVCVKKSLQLTFFSYLWQIIM